MKKNSSIEFIKNINEIDFISTLLINLCKTNNIQYILLKGEIGSGKTTLVKDIARQFNEKKNIISPTFNKMFVYDNFVHIDAYNLKGQNLVSYEDYFEDKIVIIEWAENLSHKFDEYYLVEIICENENERRYKITWKD